MNTLLLAMPPAWFVRIAAAGVRIYQGVWCKILGRAKNELRIVEAVFRHAERSGFAFLVGLELALGLRVLGGWAPGVCALAQTLLLAAINANALIWPRHLIHDPGGMAPKSFAFVLPRRVNAGLAG